LKEVRETAEKWKQEFHEKRPPPAFNGLTPALKMKQYQRYTHTTKLYALQEVVQSHFKNGKTSDLLNKNSSTQGK